MFRNTTSKFTLRQLQVLHRHGDRTPLHNVFKGKAAQALEEEKRWKKQLPTIESIQCLREKYPILHTKTSNTSSDIQINPTGKTSTSWEQAFGNLTQTGLNQMEARGKQLATFCREEQFDLENIQDKEIQVFSNTYIRTQLSVQALLSGLLEDSQHLVPNVHVLSPQDDMINTYHIYPEIAHMKQALEKENQAFAWRERTMTQRKAELMKLLPMFQSDPFTWMTVADYFICRHSHEISFIPGTEEHFDATLRHLSFRFHQFYSHRAILELVAGRITRHILTEIDRAVNEHNQYKPLVVYSGHDVSVLAMLHVIQASIVDDVSWWPAYSSALTLELLEDEEGKFFIQARLDGKILELRDRTNALYPVEEFKDLSLDAIGSIQEK